MHCEINPDDPHVLWSFPPDQFTEIDPLWRTKALAVQWGHTPAGGGVHTVVGSPRAAGSYRVDETVLGAGPELYPDILARLTTYLIGQRRLGVERPLVDLRQVEEAIAARPLSANERAMSLLEHIAQRSTVLGRRVNIAERIEVALAWAEAIEVEEVDYLIRYLADRGLLEPGSQSAACSVSVDGYTALADRRNATDGGQAFVAMWFDDTTAEAYVSGIKPGVEDAGYRARRVDESENIGKIDDLIIAEIRRSRFVVADFTQGSDGNRGSVYYEAGFAFGADVPVIFTSHEDSVDHLAFDTRQYAHIVWGEPAELRTKLAHRIEAIIGHGPRRSAPAVPPV